MKCLNISEKNIRPFHIYYLTYSKKLNPTQKKASFIHKASKFQIRKHRKAASLTPYSCKCEPLACQEKSLAAKSGLVGFSWDCEGQHDGMVPANTICKPKCNDARKTAITAHKG